MTRASNKTIKRFSRALPALEKELRSLVGRVYVTADKINQTRAAEEHPRYGKKSKHGHVAGGGL